MNTFFDSINFDIYSQPLIPGVSIIEGEFVEYAIKLIEKFTNKRTFFLVTNKRTFLLVTFFQNKVLPIP